MSTPGNAYFESDDHLVVDGFALFIGNGWNGVTLRPIYVDGDRDEIRSGSAVIQFAVAATARGLADYQTTEIEKFAFRTEDYSRWQHFQNWHGPLVDLGNAIDDACIVIRPEADDERPESFPAWKLTIQHIEGEGYLGTFQARSSYMEEPPEGNPEEWFESLNEDDVFDQEPGILATLMFSFDRDELRHFHRSLADCIRCIENA